MELELLTREEAAGFLGVPESTLDFWRATRKGPEYIKVGRHVKYNKSDLVAFLEARRVVPGRRTVGGTDAREMAV